MATSILQYAKGFTQYPELPLKITLPAKTTASSKLVVVVFGNTTGGPFNTSVLDTEVTAPTVTDDKTSTYTTIDEIDNLYEEIGSVLSSPPLISPDVSGYYLSAYAYYTSTAVTAGAQVITVTDSLFYAATTDVPRYAHDGGLYAIVFEVAGASTGLDAGHTTVTGDTVTLGAAAYTLNTNNELTFEAGMLMDSSTLVPATVATGGTVASTHSGSFPAGSSFWTIQVTQQASKAALTGFKNPIYYSGGVLSFAMVP